MRYSLTAILFIMSLQLFGQIETVKQRQFDFWIGAWDVNLRIKQTDNTWLDQVKATDHVYSILKGQAILELWNETSRENGIKGYSLRYFREDLNQWELWLNWPRKNSSTNGFLRGEFRHNRGDFYNRRTQNDSAILISRYSFNDISPTSLRWDDAYSTDDGKTWTDNWIMEFSRKATLAPLLQPGQPILTYSTGDRCDLPEFRVFEKLAGSWKGTIKSKNKDGIWHSLPVAMDTYKILEGCACMSFLKPLTGETGEEQFFIFNFNTSSGKLEQGTLTSATDAVYQSYFGALEDNIIRLDGFDITTKENFDGRYEWHMADNQVLMKEYEKKDNQWLVIREITLLKDQP